MSRPVLCDDKLRHKEQKMAAAEYAQTGRDVLTLANNQTAKNCIIFAHKRYWHA